jgi:hypothetical protein
MERRYEEKLIEEFIRDHPKEFLDEELFIYQQQPTIGGFRPDLIFLDVRERFVIVEVQLNALDRHHLYRTLEYRDLLVEQESCDVPRVILFCNEIPIRYEKLLKTHSVACISLTKAEFLEKVGNLHPDLIITDDHPPIDHGPKLTAQKILRELRGSVETNRDEPNAFVLWLPSWFPYRWERTEVINYDLLDVPQLPEGTQLYFNDFNSYDDLRRNKQVGQLEIGQLPKELIVGSEIEDISLDHIRIFADWMDLLTHYAIHDGDTIEIVLGYRSSENLYGYEDHIRNRIKKFQPLWHRYGFKKGYNVTKLREEANLLTRLTFYGGKYPSFQPIHICERILIEEGPGSLQHNVEQRRRIMQDWINRGTAGYTARSLEDFDVLVKEDRGEWLTVKFCQVNSGAMECLHELSQLLQNAAWNAKSDDVRRLIPRIGLMSPRKLCDIPSSALALSAKYFFHLKSVESPTRDAQMQANSAMLPSE